MQDGNLVSILGRYFWGMRFEVLGRSTVCRCSRACPPRDGLAGAGGF